jgi:diguanylate cyclase (GGDEF)-like protein
MISLKRYFDQSSDASSPSISDAYRATLDTMADGALRSCPSTGQTLKTELAAAAEPLKKDRSPEAFKTTHRQVLKSLRAWGEQSETYFAQKTAEVKELITELASTAETIGKRDQRYARQFADITENLQTIAQIDDLGRLRDSLLRSARALKSCVDKMAQEGTDSVAQLQASLASHRSELEQARELATLDPLTGLYNRREVEARINRKMAGQAAFCVVIIDLNNLRQINERHGRPAGDELLRQIANELRMASRAEDTLGRWGGDEFALLIDGGFMNTKIKVQRMRPWVFGNYDLNLEGAAVKVVVGASIGMAEWVRGESMLQLLTRADAELYREKSAVRL